MPAFRFTALSTGCLLACLTLPLPAQQTYKVLDHWKIGGSGGWDYLTVDSKAHRLYVSHNQRIEVLDTETGKAVGAVTGLKGTHGVALDADGHLGYISDGGANAVVVFDRKTLEKIASIPAGTNPDGILYEPVTKTVWAFNGRSTNVTVIDTKTQKVVATIGLPGKPEFPQADGRGNIFDNIEDKNSIVKLDAAGKTLVSTWQLTRCESPSGMAIDRTDHLLFSVCDGKKMAVVDYESGKQVATPEIGEGPDAAEFSAKKHLAFSSNGGDGTLSVVDSHTFKMVQSLATQRGARTMAYDAGMDRIYLATAEFGPKPKPTAENPRPRSAIVPESFTIVVVGH